MTPLRHTGALVSFGQSDDAYLLFVQKCCYLRNPMSLLKEVHRRPPISWDVYGELHVWPLTEARLENVWMGQIAVRNRR